MRVNTCSVAEVSVPPSLAALVHLPSEVLGDSRLLQASEGLIAGVRGPLPHAPARGFQGTAQALARPPWQPSFLAVPQEAVERAGPAARTCQPHTHVQLCLGLGSGEAWARGPPTYYGSCFQASHFFSKPREQPVFPIGVSGESRCQTEVSIAQSCRSCHSLPRSQGLRARLSVQVLSSLGSGGCSVICNSSAHLPAAGLAGSGGRLFLHLVLFSSLGCSSHAPLFYTLCSRCPSLSVMLVLARVSLCTRSRPRGQPA